MRENILIELKNVAVYYKERRSLRNSTFYKALKDISFEVKEGETLGIIGRNGAGKSTLLRLLAGIIKPDKGTIAHNTTSVSLMALSAGFDMNLSGRQNSIICGMLLGYSRKSILEKLEEIKKFSELQDFYEKPVKSYSSGMKARLAFSIAMYASPDVLLIDEVLGVGDVSFKLKAEQVIEDKAGSNMTVVIVSHSERQVSKLADRIIWVDGGKVRKSGPAEEVFPEYNINAKFSIYDIAVDTYEISSEFIVQFEIVNVSTDFIEYDLVLVDKNNSKISEVECYINNNKLTKMTGPGPTPKVKKTYPELKYTSESRYFGGKVEIGKDSKVIVKSSSGEHKVLDIKLIRL